MVSSALHPSARGLILAASDGEPVAFGGQYGLAVDEPSFEQITRDTLVILGLVVTGWLPAQADPADAIEVIHTEVAAAYPSCLRLLAINQVVLEQLARSVIGLSGLLAGLDASLACLYASLLVGCTLTEPAELDRLAEQLDG